MLILVNKKGLKPITQPSTQQEISEKYRRANNPNKAENEETVRADQ